MEERMPGDPAVDPRADEALPEEQPDEVFEVDGDTTGADPDADDPAVNVRPRRPGGLA